MDLDNRTGRTGPLWDSRNAAAKSGVIHLIDENAEESSGLFIRVLLELGVDLDDER